MITVLLQGIPPTPLTSRVQLQDHAADARVHEAVRTITILLKKCVCLSALLVTQRQPGGMDMKFKCALL